MEGNEKLGYSEEARRFKAQVDAQDRVAGYGIPSDGNANTLSVDMILNELFTYHPATLEQMPAYKTIREAGRHMVKLILELCPPCADRSDAIRKVREAVMTANQSVACRGLSL